MGELIGQGLFVVAVVGLIALVGGGALFGAVTLIFAAMAPAQDVKPPNHPDRLFHHPDHVQTPVYESLFMVIVVGLLAVGLPAALAAIFHFVVPLVGQSWVP